MIHDAFSPQSTSVNAHACQKASILFAKALQEQIAFHAGLANGTH
jgi:hypothetical protein